MEKLLKLLNEYQTVKENWYKWEWNWWELFEYDEEKKPMLTYEYNWFSTAEDDAVAIMISKSYWFIRWLVKNWYTTLESWSWFANTVSEKSLITICAISDNPIQTLLTYLK